jgi:hypothetical protein
MLSRRNVLFGAVALLAPCAPPAFAHPLPDSILVFSERGGALHIALEMPLHELNLAVPEVHEALSANTTMNVLMPYIDAHLKILSLSGERQKLALTQVSFDSRNDVDVGSYTVLLAELTLFQVGDFSASRFQIQMDMILHEVPNHAFALHWRDPVGRLESLGSVTYDFNSKSNPLRLINKP